MMSNDDYMRETFIIIPAFNEKAVISEVVEQLLHLGSNIVVVDDGSSEDLKTELEKYTQIDYIRHKVNLGQGAALQTGLSFALKKKAEYIITFDADGQHSAEDIPAILAPLLEGQVDIVLASRFLIEGSHNAATSKQVLLKAGRWVNYFFTGLYLSDAHNGLRAMTRKAASTLTITENRMAHATEIIAQIKKHKLRYKEIGAKVTYTNYSRSKGQSSLNSLKIFFDLVLQKLFG